MSAEGDSRDSRVLRRVPKYFTPTIGPIVLKRMKGANYYLKSVCGACNSVKPFKDLNKLQVKAFPEDLRNMPEKSDSYVSKVPAELNPIIPEWRTENQIIEPNPMIPERQTEGLIIEPNA